MRRELWQQVLFDDHPYLFLQNFSQNQNSLKMKHNFLYLYARDWLILLARPWLFPSTCPTLKSLFHLSPFCGEEITNSYRMWVTGERNKSRYVTSRLFMIHQLLLMALPLFRPSGHENETWIYVFAPQNAAFVCFSLQVK